MIKLRQPRHPIVEVASSVAPRGTLMLICSLFPNMCVRLLRAEGVPQERIGQRAFEDPADLRGHHPRQPRRGLRV